jgi:Protein of unknown function (DUF1761)
MMKDTKLASAAQEGYIRTAVGSAVAAYLVERLVAENGGLGGSMQSAMTFWGVLTAVNFAVMLPHDFFEQRHPTLHWLHTGYQAVFLDVVVAALWFLPGAASQGGAAWALWSDAYLSWQFLARVLVGFVLVSFVGMQWYGPLFGDAWCRAAFGHPMAELMRKHEKDPEWQASGARAMQMSFVSATLVSLLFQVVALHFFPAAPLVADLWTSTVRSYLGLAFILALIPAALDISRDTFESKHPRLFLIRHSYHMAYFTLLAVATPLLRAYLP